MNVIPNFKSEQTLVNDRKCQSFASMIQKFHILTCDFAFLTYFDRIILHSDLHEMFDYLRIFNWSQFCQLFRCDPFIISQECKTAGVIMVLQDLQKMFLCCLRCSGKLYTSPTYIEQPKIRGHGVIPLGHDLLASSVASYGNNFFQW